MPVKPPRGGSAHVDTDVHTFPKRSSDKDFIPADVPVRDGTVPWARLDDPKSRSTQPGADAGPETILPAPVVEVRPAPDVAGISAVIHRSLETYLITSVTELPDADGDGFRMYRNRRYVDVPGSGLVLVAVDPDTGWYRARHPGELIPSGPWMLRDSESGIWHPHSDFSTRTNPLTAESLDGFHAGLDISGAQSGSDGVIRHDGKLYVAIHEQAYQVMQDLDASRPEYRVGAWSNPTIPSLPTARTFTVPAWAVKPWLSPAASRTLGFASSQGCAVVWKAVLNHLPTHSTFTVPGSPARDHPGDSRQFWLRPRGHWSDAILLKRRINMPMISLRVMEKRVWQKSNSSGLSWSFLD